MKSKKHGWELTCLLISLASLVFIPFYSESQVVRKWEAAAHAGYATMWSDVKAQPGFGGGLSLSRNLSPGFSLRADYTGHMLRGMNLRPHTAGSATPPFNHDPWHSYYTSRSTSFVPNYRAFLHQGSASGIINFSRWRFPATNTHAHLYAGAGYSLIVADVDVDALDARLTPYNFNSVSYSGSRPEIRNRLASLLDGKYESSGFHPGNTATTSKNFLFVHGANISIGTGYAFSDKLAAGIEYRVTAAFTDHLDALADENKNEFVQYLHARLSYSLGGVMQKKWPRSSSHIYYTPAEQLVSEGGIINAIVYGEAGKSTADSGYFINFVFVPAIPGNVYIMHSVSLKLQNKQVLLLPYAGNNAPLVVGTDFVYRTRISRTDLQLLSTNKVTDIRLETSAFALEDRLPANKQRVLPVIAKKLLRR